MTGVISSGSTSSEVERLQMLLNERGYHVAVDGIFGRGTMNALRAFQAQNLDQHGQPLVADGKAGPLTWWSLMHPKPSAQINPVVSFLGMPPVSAGGSSIGRSALRAAIGECRNGAGEIGGNNRGKWVRQYLAPAGIAEGNPWCASFVSWCYLQSCGGKKSKMPFQYNPGARSLMRSLDKNGWTHPPGSDYAPVPGDLVFWWRVKSTGWQGHVGLVHQLSGGMLYTIEGNKSPKVAGFSYVYSRMDKLLGFGHIPDA